MSIDKDMWMRKANNLAKSPQFTKLPTPNKIQLDTEESEESLDSLRLDANKIISKKQVIEEINSDLENVSAK